MKINFKKILNYLKTNKKFLFLSLFFFTLQFIIIYNNGLNNKDLYFWFCNHTPFLLGIFFLFKKIDYIKSLINFGFLAQLVWAIDFLSKIILGVHIFNITNYIFTKNFTYLTFVSIITHLFTMNLTLLYTIKYETKKITLLYSFFYILLIYFLTLYFTSPYNNINWIYNIGNEKKYDFYLYTYLWPFLTFTFLILPTYFIQKYFYKNLKKVTF